MALFSSRLCVTHSDFTRRREVAKEKRTVMTDLVELGGFYGDSAGEQVVLSPCFLSDFAPLRETF